MGILTTVRKKPESGTGLNATVLTGNDEKKMLVNINSRIEDLKVQNLENARFLRGISKKIENEFQQMREQESSGAIEMMDDSAILESIERVERSLEEINSHELLAEIEKINLSINGMSQSMNQNMSQSAVIEGIDKINQSIGEINTVDIVNEIQKLKEIMEHMDLSGVLSELDKINETMGQVNADVLLLEIDKINKSLRSINSDKVLDEIEKTNDKIDRINLKNIQDELHRMEELISEISSEAVLSELERVRQLIAGQNYKILLTSIDERVSRIKMKDYTERLEEIKQLLEQNINKQEELEQKISRISTMPSMLKAMIERGSDITKENVENAVAEQNYKVNAKLDSLKFLVSAGLWASIVTAALTIANVFGMI